jgi:hypothetical protein
MDKDCLFRKPGWLRPANAEEPFHYLVTLDMAEYRGLEMFRSRCQGIILEQLSRLSDAWLVAPRRCGTITFPPFPPFPLSPCPPVPFPRTLSPAHSLLNAQEFDVCKARLLPKPICLALLCFHRISKRNPHIVPSLNNCRLFRCRNADERNYNMWIDVKLRDDNRDISHLSFLFDVRHHLAAVQLRALSRH